MVNHRFLDRLNREKPITMRKLEDIWYEGNGADYGRSQHYNSSRYHMLNLHATFTKGTIEFRLFQFADPANGKRNEQFDVWKDEALKMRGRAESGDLNLEEYQAWLKI